LLLQLDAVGKAFGGVSAVDGVSFGVAQGQVHGLIGPNGAGKTTLINLISGLMRPDRGAICFDGQRIDRLPPYRVAALGIRRTYQNIRLFPAMTARENVTVGQHTRRTDTLLERLWFSPRVAAEERRLRDEALRLLARVDVSDLAEVRASNLSYGDQRRLEIARALGSEPRLLLLDEPAAGMNGTEARALGRLVRSLVGDGLTVLLVEHNVRLVMEVCDGITVLDFGRVIADGTPAEVSRDEAVIAAYLGTDDDQAADVQETIATLETAAGSLIEPAPAQGEAPRPGAETEAR